MQCDQIVISNLIWILWLFPNWILWFQTYFRSNTQEAASCVLYLTFSTLLISFLYNKKNFCFSFAGTNLWNPRNSTMTEKNRSSQRSRITNVFTALSFDRQGQSFSEFIHNTASAFNSLKIAPWYQLPWNHRVAATLLRHKSVSK